MKPQTFSPSTRNNWLLDMGLLTSGLVAAVSGVYFLFFPIGGYRGGRNPYAFINILFARHTWEDLHTWGGIAMILIACVHIAVHWAWFRGMVRRTWNELRGKCGCLNPRGRWNLALNLVVGISFILTAFSGIYLLFVPGGRYALDPAFLFTRRTWDLIHTWAGVLFIGAALTHIVIHWRWIVNVTRKILGTVTPGRSPSSAPSVGQP